MKPLADIGTVIFAATLVLGCSSTTELIGDGGAADDASMLPGLQRLEVTPETTDLVIDDLTVVHTIPHTATGYFMDGSSRDVTGEVSWGVDNAAPGDFSAPGRWRGSNGAGGRVSVEARSGTVSGAAVITVVFKPTIADDTFPPTANVADLFDPNTPVVVDDPMSPQIAYPAHEVMFPINVYRVLFQYDQPAGPDTYRIRFQSPYLDMTIYTTGDRWQADETTWSFLAATNAGDKAVMTVAAVDSTAPTTIYESAPIDVYFSRSAVEGAIYFWSTSSEGVMKGVISDPAPSKFYTEPPDTTCVACHTVSRDGTRLAVGYDGETLQALTIPDRVVTIPATLGYGMGWSTFSPDSSLLLSANDGTLTLYDTANGEPVGANDGVVDLGGALVTHPDWSPLGDYVVLSACVEAKNKETDRCSLARVRFDAGTWGPLEILLQADLGANENNFFPKYSPDGKWIAYSFANGKSKNQKLAELRLIPAGGGSPIVLTKATRRVGPSDNVPETGSNMPTWAPTTHPGTQWLAFSSVRDYGKVLTSDSKADQLWVVALDLARAEQGSDPSFAAFWLPLQDVLERNHRAFWATDTDQPCTGSVEVCDGFDNDCDGMVDEGCLACQPQEICFDGIDNECNGVIDDGCIQ